MALGSKVNSAGKLSSRVFGLEAEAHGLADRLPDLVMQASRVAATVAQGIHGRRRAGAGETFWQFRHYQSADAATQIDWRRSGSSDHLFVREREWEAAHTVWLWSDHSPSMDFKSHLSHSFKRDRALVLMFAAGELLVRGGERIALYELMAPTASRRAIPKMAEAIAGQFGKASGAGSQNYQVPQSLPPKVRLSRFATTVLFSDFLEPAEATIARLSELAADGASGHLVMVLDPAEESLPYEGRTEFVGLEGGERWLADRAESLRDRYIAKLKAHRAQLEEATRKLGWSLLVHHTDRPAEEALLALTMRLSGLAHDYRARSNLAVATAGDAVRGEA